MGTRWPKTLNNTKKWEATGKKPVTLQTGMRKWRWVGNTLRKSDRSAEKQALNWNSLGARSRGRPNQTWKIYRFGGSRKMRQNMERG
jgi:hypothetical protein